jgi:hypothetical protein
LEEAQQIESAAQPVREKVKELYAGYKKDYAGGEEQDASASMGSYSQETMARFANYRPDSGNGQK